MWRTLCVVLLLMSGGLAIGAGRQHVATADVWHIRALVAAADAAMKGEFTADAHWLRLQPHFLRSPDGQVYVPFTLAIVDVAQGSLESVAMYVRVAKRGERTTAADYASRSLGPGPGGGLPVFSYDAAAAASAALRVMDNAGNQRSPFLFQAAHLTPLDWAGRTGFVRRAMKVPSGSYDVYVAVRDRSGDSNQATRAGVLKRVLEVPEFSATELSVTPPILAADVQSIRSPLTSAQQAARPYALGAFEVVPKIENAFTQADELNVILFVYNAGADLRGKPAVVADYRFWQVQSDGAARQVARPLRAHYDANTLPKEFDLQAGHELAPMQSVSLASFSPGRYRVEVVVTDTRMSAVVSTSADFDVR